MEDVNGAKRLNAIESKIEDISAGNCPVCGAAGLRWDRNRDGWRICPVCTSTINLGKLVENHLFMLKFGGRALVQTAEQIKEV